MILYIMDIDGNPSGGDAYDQSLNTSDNVEFKSISTTKNCLVEGTAPTVGEIPAGEVCLYAKTDKKLYYKDDTGAETAVSGGGGGGGTAQDEWKFDTTLSGAPASGYFRFDNATPNLATLINVNYTNNAGNDFSPLLKTLKAGDNIFLSSADGTNIKMYQITLNIDQTTYAELKVDFERETSVANYSLDDVITITYFTNGEGGANINSSTGVLAGGVLSIGTLNTQFNISDGYGQVLIDDPLGTGKLSLTNVAWSGLTDITVTNIGTQLITFVSINSSGTVLQESSRPSVELRRHQIYLGVVVHVNLTSIDVFNNQQDYAVEPLAQWRDLTQAIGFLNINGNNLTYVSDQVTHPMTIIKSAGTMFATGSNYADNPHSPNWRDLPEIDTSGSGIFQYRMQNGNSGSISETQIQANILDDGTNYPGTTVSVNKFTIQRFYIFTSNNLKIQPGQNEFNSMQEAEDNLFTETYIIEPSIEANGMLIGYMIIKEGTTDLSVTSDVKFFDAGKFGSIGGGGTTTSLQVAFNNSVAPQIETDATNTKLQIKNHATNGVAFEIVDTDASYLLRSGATGTVVNRNSATTSTDAVFGVAGAFTVYGDDTSKFDGNVRIDTPSVPTFILKEDTNFGPSNTGKISFTDVVDVETAKVAMEGSEFLLESIGQPLKIKGSSDIILDSTVVRPETTTDLGTVSKPFKDLYLSGNIVGASPSTESIASGASITPNIDNVNMSIVNALAVALTINAPTGTAKEGQTLLLRIKDDGTSRTLTWNAVFEGIVVSPLPTATVAGKWQYWLAIYNVNTSKWDIIAETVQV